MISCVAELAFHFDGLSFIDHFLDLFSSHADHRLLYSLFRTVTVKLRVNGICDLQPYISKQDL